MHLIFPKPQAFPKIFWAHVSITCYQPWMLRGPSSFQNCFQQCFVSRRPSFRMPEVHREDTQSSSDVQLLQGCTTPPDVCLRSSSPTVSSVILAARAANLHPSLASLLNCSFISSFLNLCSIPKKISNVPLYLHKYFCSVLQAETFSHAHLNLFSSFLTSVQSTPSDSFHFLWCFSFYSS